MEGYTVWIAGNGHDALEQVYVREPDAVILDLRLPDIDGFVLCSRLRHLTAVPIIVLTALNQEADLVRALDGGADDYLTKPFSPAELLARVRAHLRRQQSQMSPDAPRLSCGPFQLRPATRELVVTLGESRTVRLTPTEWRLMGEFLRYCDKVIPHEQLLRQVWGPDYQGEHEYLRIYVRRLRQYVEPDPRHPRYLVSYAGIGYALHSAPRHSFS
ncbi:two component transcriptional regulator, winged helix family [Sulfobacillus acidophilus TPY]|nr:two component transcriptional regulator, winged helix family [Sulfobacillus acidophilus TPY]